MACLDIDSPQLFPNRQSYDDPFNLELEDSILDKFLAVPDASTSSLSNNVTVPKPPPLPNASYGKTNISKRITGCDCIPHETRHAWDRLFDEGYKADVHVLTDDKGLILAHSNVLVSASRSFIPRVF